MSRSSWMPPLTVRSTRIASDCRSTGPVSSRNASFEYSKRAEKNWIGAELSSSGRRPLIRRSYPEISRVSRVKKPSSIPPRIRRSAWHTRNRSSRLIVIDAGPTWTGNVTIEMIGASGGARLGHEAVASSKPAGARDGADWGGSGLPDRVGGRRGTGQARLELVGGRQRDAAGNEGDEGDRHRQERRERDGADDGHHRDARPEGGEPRRMCEHNEPCEPGARGDGHRVARRIDEERPEGEPDDPERSETPDGEHGERPANRAATENAGDHVRRGDESRKFEDDAGGEGRQPVRAHSRRDVRQDDVVAAHDLGSQPRDPD